MLKKIKLPKLPIPSVAIQHDPKTVARGIVIALLALNAIAALFVFKPWGSSADDINNQLRSLQKQVQQKRIQVEKARLLGAKIDKGREEGDAFIAQAFLDRETAYSTVLGALGQMSKAAGITMREHGFNYDLVEGSDTIGMLTITGAYEGTYADLVNFLNKIDKSDRFMILEQLSATPQQQSQRLMSTLKINTFVREDPDNRRAGN